MYKIINISLIIIIIIIKRPDEDNESKDKNGSKGKKKVSRGALDTFMQSNNNKRLRTSKGDDTSEQETEFLKEKKKLLNLSLVEVTSL